MRELQDALPEKGEISGYVCIDCDANNAAVVLTDAWLKCKSCGSTGGFNPSGIICSCGSTTFQATKNRLMCISCGADTRWK